MVATVAAGTTAEYYLAQCDYYVGGSEPAGRWVRVGVAVGVHVGSVVEREPFERLHAALDAEGRFMLAGKSGKKQRVGGYDVTFSAPKSCSILWAIADDELRAKIGSAQAHAVEVALKALEANAAFCRSGKDGVRVQKVNLTVAAFQHGDARPAKHSDGKTFADCALHTHTIIANIGRKSDLNDRGERGGNKADRRAHGALDGKAIFAFKMAAGAVYHAQLSKNFQGLGFAVGDIGKNGIWEVVGIAPQLKSYFSARRTEIEGELEAAGTNSANAPALAAAITRATRKAKQKDHKQDRFAFWQERAHELGFDRNTVIESCFAAGREQQASFQQIDREGVVQSRLAALPGQLTEHESTFERRHLYAAIAAAFVGSGVGAERVESEIANFIATKAVVTLDHDAWGHEFFTTPEILRIESEIGEMAARLARKSPSAPSPSIVSDLIRKHGLNQEQADAVRAATSGAKITILEGAPGAGKTTALAAITGSWAHADVGCRVIGAATAWKISLALKDDLAIDSRATDSWRVGAEHGVPFLDQKTVLIVDEAGLLSSRQMHSILSAVEAADENGLDPHLILVGDRNQLQSVGAGPGLALAANFSSVQSVTKIVRQREEWTRDAVVAFGRGDAGEALEAFDARGLLHETIGPKATVCAIVDAWEAYEKTTTGSSLLIAKTNTQVRAISAEVRARLRRQHAIRGEDVILKAVTSSNLIVPLPLADGDRIRFLARLKVGGIETINGTEGTVESIRAAGDERFDITVRTSAGRFTFATDEIADDKGRVKISHAYATTIYGSQGCTTDRAFVWLSPEMDRHSILVASSRARDATDLFCDRKSLDSRIISELPLSERSGANEIDSITRRTYLADQLARSGFKRSSLDILLAAQAREPAQLSHEAERVPERKARATRSRGNSREMSLE